MKLSVLYDPQCGFCVKCRWWLLEQPKFVPMDFHPAGTRETARLFPELHTTGKPEELIVVDSEGGVYRGTDAWLMCLWALEEYREWADRLAAPALKPFARAAFGMVSAGRKKISSWFRMAPEEELVEGLRHGEPPRCATP